MKRLVFIAIACTLLFTGCGIDTSKIPILGNKSDKDKSNEEYTIEYDDDGNVIPVEVTDPETGETYMIDPELGLRIDTSIEDDMINGDDTARVDITDISYSDLLGQTTSYPQLTITLYGINGKPRIVDQYVYDDFNNTAVRYEYDAYNTVSMTYFDNKTNKAYTNLGMRSWQELSNERLEGLQVMLNPNGFQQEELYKSGDFLYISGVLPLSSVGTGRDVISRMIVNNFKSLSNIKVNGLYKSEDNTLLRLEMHITTEEGDYLLSVVPTMIKQVVKVPENVLNKEQPKEQEISTEMNRIPIYAYLKPVVYGNTDEVSRDIVLSTYGFKRVDITNRYGADLDINAYIERLGTIIDDDMSIFDFVKNQNDGLYADAVDQAAYSTIYEFMLKRDKEMTDEEIAALEIKPEPVQYPIEYDEEGNLILIEESDENGDTIWINPETGKQVNEDGSPIAEETEGEENEQGEEGNEEESEPDGRTMITTANVNVRKGPGTGFDKIGSAAAGTAVTVVGEDATDPTWFKIILADGTEGYIKSDYLKE